MNGTLVFLSACALVAISASIGVSLLGLQRLVDQLLAWALLASTAIVGTLMLAGAVLDDLSSRLVIALNAIVATLLVLVWLGRGHRPPSDLRSALEARLRAVRGALRRDLWLLILLVVASAELAWRLVIAYALPPYAGDALWYHLTTVGGWLQEGRIGPSELSIWSTVHPHNGELLFTWPALLLGEDTFVDAVQLPYAVVGAVAVAGVGRHIGLSRSGSSAAACLFLLTPIVLSQTTASYVDVIFIAFFVAAFHFVLRFVAELRDDPLRPRYALVLLAGVGGGLALGTKSLGISYIGVLVVVLVVHLVLVGLRTRVAFGKLSRSLVVFLVPLVALGAYHYLETWVRFGNPVYPVRVAVLGLEVFDGQPIERFLSTPPVEGSWWRQIWAQWHADHFFLTEPRFHAYSYDGRPSGLGPVWSYLALPLLVALVVRLLRSNRTVLYGTFLPVVVMVAFQPYRWWSRFTMILIVVGVIAIVFFVERLPQRWSDALKVFTLALVALGLFFPTFKIDGELWANRILEIGAKPASERTIGRVALPGYAWADTVARDASIGVDTTADFFGAQPYLLAYPLFGPRFEHRVRPLPRESENGFRSMLARERIRYVFVAREGKLDRWTSAATRDGCARLLYDGPVYAGHAGRAYELVPGCSWTPATGKA